MSVTISMTLDTRRMKQKTGMYPVKMLVIHNRKPLRYQTVYDLTEAEYRGLSARNISDALRPIRDDLKRIQREAEDAAQGIEPFNFPQFEKDFILNNPSFHQRKSVKTAAALENHAFDQVTYNNRFPIFQNPKPEPDTILAVFLYYISKLLNEHRIRTAANYQTAYNTISRFRGNIRFVDINVAFLKQLEAWMLAQEFSNTRLLRAIFNEAIFQGIIRREKHYPFGRRQYQPPASRNIKKALELGDVSKLYYYQPECERERKAKDFWLFSYFGNGMNPTDIAHLKFKNIDGEYIIFERSKTENTTRLDPRPITVYITEDMQKIIDYWGNKDRKPDNYLFPVLEHGITPLRQVELIELFVQSINDWMEKIRVKLGIEKKVTTYVARHTFSTVMKRSGVSTEFIRESLGHTSLKTTESYLDSFEKNVKKEYSKNLLTFKRTL